MTTTLDAVQDALAAVLAAAFSDMDDPVAFKVDDPRRIDVDADDVVEPEEGEDEQVGSVRSLASLQPGSSRDVDAAVGLVTVWTVQARFTLFVDVVGEDDVARKRRARAIRNLASTTISTDFTLGGAASYARCRDLDRETLIEEGMPVEHLENLGIEVEFDSLTPVG